MNYYANDEERVRLIAGLRDLADFLNQNPGVPVPRGTDVLVFPAKNPGKHVDQPGRLPAVPATSVPTNPARPRPVTGRLRSVGGEGLSATY